MRVYYTSNRQRKSNCEKKVNVTNFEFPKSLYKSKYGESTVKSRSLEEKDDEKENVHIHKKYWMR